MSAAVVGQRQIGRMRAGCLAHGINLNQGALHCDRACHVARNPDGKEDRVETSLTHPRNVQIAVRVSRAEIERLVEDQPLGGISMAVDDDGARVQLFRTVGDLRRG